ncbi:MAG: apolipoprotein N-acyltransferase [Nitrospirae bacterium]|nr:apolipoprotein N-acyltransferase [Nitrospirota bacterium]
MGLCPPEDHAPLGDYGSDPLDGNGMASGTPGLGIPLGPPRHVPDGPSPGAPDRRPHRRLWGLLPDRGGERRRGGRDQPSDPDKERGKVFLFLAAPDPLRRDRPLPPLHDPGLRGLAAITEAAGRGAELVVWPETAVPFFFQNPSPQREEIRSLARSENIHLLFGSPSHKIVDRASPQPPRPMNSAYLISPEGAVLGRYDKIHLVPFGEYVPLPRLLFFVNRMAQGIGDFVPGETFTVMASPKGKIGTVICFEVIFPELVRQFTDEGADLMVTITNDAWFGKSAAPYQHFDQVFLRAVENRIPFARAANTGISGFVDPQGRVLEAGPLFKETFLVESLPLRSRKTFYTRFGDLFAYGCLLGSAGLIGMGCFRVRPGSPGSRGL